MKLLLILTLCGPTKAHTTDTLPPAPELHAALDVHHDAIALATLAEFSDAGSQSWMNWTPSVGIGYAPNGEPRPAASFSLAQVFTNLQRRKERKAKRQSLQAALQIERENAHRQLDEMLHRFELMNLELATMREIHEINISLYQLAISDYEEAKIPPSEFLPKKKSYLQEGLNLTRKEIELKNLEMEILVFAHY